MKLSGMHLQLMVRSPFSRSKFARTLLSLSISRPLPFFQKQKKAGKNTRVGKRNATPRRRIRLGPSLRRTRSTDVYRAGPLSLSLSQERAASLVEGSSDDGKGNTTFKGESNENFVSRAASLLSLLFRLRFRRGNKPRKALFSCQAQSVGDQHSADERSGSRRRTRVWRLKPLGNSPEPLGGIRRNPSGEFAETPTRNSRSVRAGTEGPRRRSARRRRVASSQRPAWRREVCFSLSKESSARLPWKRAGTNTRGRLLVRW